MARSTGRDERKPPTTTGGEDLEPRVAELELQVASLDEQVELLDERVTALEESAEPIQPPITEPPPTEPPPVTEPPPAVGGEDVIKDGKTLSQLCASGGVVELPAGTYHGTTVISTDTEVTGQGTILTCEGLTAAQGKAMFAANAGLTLRNLTIRDVTVPDMNGAAVRTEPGISIILENCEITNCQNGVLTAFGPGGTVTISNCNFHDNGSADGGTHEIYCNDIESVTCTDSEFVCGMKSSHAVKSRAFSTVIRNCRLVGSPDTTGNVAGSTLDTPNGGDVLVENTIIEGSPGHVQLVGYAMENQNSGIKTVTLRGVTVISKRGDGEVSSAAGGNLILENCKYQGTNPPALLGWTQVQGEFTAV